MYSRILKDRLKLINKNLDSKPSVYDSFLTTFGKDFEQNYQDLIEFVIITCSMPSLLKTFSNIFGNISRRVKDRNLELLDDVKEKHGNVVEISNELDKIKDNIQEEFQKSDKIENETSLSKYIKNARILERVNSYFFLTLYSYIDLYTMSLFQFISANVEVVNLYDIIENFKPSRNPAERLKQILKQLEFSDSKMSNIYLKLQEASKFENSLYSFIKLRNYFAHRDPKKAVQEIKNKFPKFTEKARKESSTIIKDLEKEELYAYMDKDQMKTDFESLIILTLIGKDCYIHLAIIDFLINNYFKNE